MKGYNGLKQRLTEIGTTKNLLYIWLFVYICLKVLEKIDWNIFFNNIIYVKINILEQMKLKIVKVETLLFKIMSS